MELKRSRSENLFTSDRHEINANHIEIRLRPYSFLIVWEIERITTPVWRRFHAGLAPVYRCLPVLIGVCRCLQVLTGAYRCLQVFVGVYRCL